MARFSFHDSYRADCFLRALQTAEQMLADELDERQKETGDVSAWGFLSSFADVALVLGITEEQWTQVYRENAAYYREQGIQLK